MTRAEAQVAALVQLLQTLPESHLSAVLDGLGVAKERRPEPYQDTRRCRTCGWGWVRHKALADHPADGHAWDPSEGPRERGPLANVTVPEKSCNEGGPRGD